MLKANPSAGIETLEPKAVWRLFAGIARVPRPSKKEEKIQAHVKKLAADQGWKLRQDAPGNIVIEVPATQGCEKAPIVVLQGHLDMVCEKNADKKHDFENDPIQLVMDKHGNEPIVRADGTTLGADNGIGVCMSLAAAMEKDVVHGPLEILCTTDEEAGMTGAKALQPEFIKGRTLINLDSEEDGALYIGCAGGSDTNTTWTFETQPLDPKAEVCRVFVSGMKGGHSGCDIHLNRVNAIKALAKVFIPVLESGVRLLRIKGGNLHNAIPREAEATVAGPAGLIKSLQDSARLVMDIVVKPAGEAEGRITVEPQAAGGAAALSAVDTRRLLDAQLALPQGVLAVVPQIPGLIQTSSNVSTIKTQDAGGRLQVIVGCLSRSSSDPQLHATLRQLEAIGRLSGGVVTRGNEYPGWDPNPDSPLLKMCIDIHERVMGEKPKVTAIHAGLECGIIGKRIPGMEMVSFGPQIEGAHSPDERVYIKSVEKTWRYLKTVLAELARK